MEENRNKKFGKWLLWIGTLSAVIAVFILVSNIGENNSYGKYLPYGLLLLCPLSHLFMMNMHKDSHNHDQTEEKENSKSCH